jgi:hypothetical protein
VVYRGSRKHVLDWTDRPAFLSELAELLVPVPVRFAERAPFMPCGYSDPMEARLERFGPKLMAGSSVWPALRDWWLVHKAGANTPNWDIAAGCELEGRPGLVLVEAKANWTELGVGSKPLSSSASIRSTENHARIAGAIEEACRGWREIDSDVRISCDSHYQLANRLAFTWKLAELGVSVVLVYLGFTGDAGIADAGKPFANPANWQAAFGSYAADCGALKLFGRRHEVAGTPVWLLARSRRVLEGSPARRVLPIA